MKKVSKTTIALAAVGGTMLMVAPMALASTYDPTGAQVTGASSSQWQSGCGASGATLDQNSSISTGQIQAQNYYNSSVGYGGSSSTNNYVVEDGGSTLSSSTASSNAGGSSWTNASNYSAAGSSVTQNQSQNITGGWFFEEGGNGGMQAQHAIAGTVNVDQEWNLSGGIAGSHQFQNGQGANQAVLNQSANIQTGSTTASSYQFDVNNNPSQTSTNQYSDGALTTSTASSSNGGGSYTKATNYSNPTAGVSQDQSQVIGLDGNGASKQEQSSWAVAGTVTDQFWQSVF